MKRVDPLCPTCGQIPKLGTSGSLACCCPGKLSEYVAGVVAPGELQSALARKGFKLETDAMRDHYYNGPGFRRLLLYADGEWWSADSKTGDDLTEYLKGLPDIP